MSPYIDLVCQYHTEQFRHSSDGSIVNPLSSLGLSKTAIAAKVTQRREQSCKLVSVRATIVVHWLISQTVKCQLDYCYNEI